MRSKYLHLWWWTNNKLAFIIASPVLIPLILFKLVQFRFKKQYTINKNSKRIDIPHQLNIPEIKILKLSCIVDHFYKNGFHGNPGVSYLLETDKGSLLMDIGFGSSTDAFSHNYNQFNISSIDGLLITHLHGDHMGGKQAMEENRVILPSELSVHKNLPIYVPQYVDSANQNIHLITQPTILENGIVSTGPLSRAMFYLGITEEQALFVNIKDKGLIIITGCGHPTIEIIIQMVESIIPNVPIYGIIGGLHFPLKESRGQIWGIPFQQVLGTGKRIWNKINEEDLMKTIHFLQKYNVQKMFLSAHDTCDYALNKFKEELAGEVIILESGGKYEL